MSMQVILFGDSIAWGQGLNQADKFSTLISNRLATYLGAQGIGVELHSYAHSGATVWPDGTNGNAPGWGEVPASAPPIVTQVAMARNELGAVAQQPCLVLLVGGLNDVKLTNIFTIDPTIFDKPNWIARITTEHVGQRMQDLLGHIVDAFPQAFVIVASYFQIVSRDSVGVPAAEAALGVFLNGLIGGALVVHAFNAKLREPMRGVRKGVAGWAV